MEKEEIWIKKLEEERKFAYCLTFDVEEIRKITGEDPIVIEMNIEDQYGFCKQEGMWCGYLDCDPDSPHRVCKVGV
jgi:hypothetical protein